MRVLLLNEVLGTTSTGKICAGIAEEYEAQGCEVKVAFGRWANVPEKYQRFAHYFGSDIEVRIHGLLTRVFDAQGCGSKGATKKFLKWADKYNPDLLWLHNIHGYYVNYKMLFNWIKERPKMKVQWTLHDCWAFTGHCVYFTMCNCDKWRKGCDHCPQKREYPASFLFDRSKKNYRDKRDAFTGVNNMQLITPSKWLADLTRDSYLKDYPVVVRYNDIDTSIFRATKSDFKSKYGIEDKKIVLGVSNAWQEPRKGLEDFYKLAASLSNEYVIVLVGLTDELIKTLPKGIIGIKKTDSSQELAGIYSEAEVLFNPTYEDNYPTVNLEAEACGTRVVTYASGGAPETIHKKESAAVKPGDIKEVIRIIERA